MSHKIKIAINGYGNLGRGVERAINQAQDLELVAVFTRRDPSTVETVYETTPVYHVDKVLDLKDEIDVMILCGGSATDLPEQSPYYSQYFNIVDSFDNHNQIPDHYQKVDETSRQAQTTSVISVGWDPGLFSLVRALGQAVLPEGKTYTFWGKGLSQGHSDAIRRVPGVKAGVQYTIPSKEAQDLIRQGGQPDLVTNQMHTRECFVVLEEGADPSEVEEAIVTMPDYFEPYETTVNFISMEELQANHSQMPHGGIVLRSGYTGEGNHHLVEFSLDLSSNPEFTSSVLVAFARASWRLNQEGQYGAKTIYDIPIGAISPLSKEELQRKFL